MITLAVEDVLGEALGRRLLKHGGFTVTRVLGNKGNGWLQKNGCKLNQAAKHMSILVLTDSDGKPPAVVVKTICVQSHEPRFLVSVCVTEAESWLLADAPGLSALLGGGMMKIPNNPDSILNAKEFLIRHAQKYGKGPVKQALVPKRRSKALVGPQYNFVLTRFVEQDWNILTARKASPSLRACLASITNFPR